MMRKIATWEQHQPAPYWTATLECGHRSHEEYEDYGYTDATKELLEAEGNEMHCSECERAQQRIAQLEKQLAEAKARLK